MLHSINLLHWKRNRNSLPERMTGQIEQKENVRFLPFAIQTLKSKSMVRLRIFMIPIRAIHNIGELILCLNQRWSFVAFAIDAIFICDDYRQANRSDFHECTVKGLRL